MIEKIQAYKIGEKMFDSFESAQEHELSNLVKKLQPGLDDSIIASLVVELLGHRSEAVDILTMSPRSRAKSRKINGASRKRKAKVVETVEVNK